MIARKLSLEFKEMQEEITEAYISVGMITDNIYDMFMRAVRNAKIISIITGIHMPTSPEVLQKLKDKADRKELYTGIYTKKYFHPKLYLFKLKKEWKAFVGSGNFTNGGWYGNEELFIIVTNQDICNDLLKWHEQWFAGSEPITDKLISLYTSTYQANKARDRETRKRIQDLVDNIHDQFNIDNVNFDGQYLTSQA